MEINRQKRSEDLAGRLHCAESLGTLLQDRDRVSNLQITRHGMTIDYELQTQHSIFTGEPLPSVARLDLRSSDYRDASFTIMLEGSYESALSRILLSLAMHSKHFLDVGANIGLYSCAVAIVNGTCQVDSLEPNPTLWERFERNVKLNALHSQVSLHKVGLGKTGAKVAFFVPPVTGSGGGSLRIQHSDEGAHAEIEVNIVPIDELAGLPALDLVKIDVEGAEFEVFESLSDSISVAKPTIVIELLRKWMAPFGKHPMDVVQPLLAHGYKLFAITETGLRETTVIDSSTEETNFLFWHPSASSHWAVIESELREPPVLPLLPADS